MKCCEYEPWFVSKVLGGHASPDTTNFMRKRHVMFEKPFSCPNKQKMLPMGQYYKTFYDRNYY
jgi:hypothetical protein